MTNQAAPYDYDVAVSFAGEDRTFVAEVVTLLKAAGIKVFYDRDEQSSLWGENLVDFLDGVYQHRARFAMVFVSRHYVEKAWPNHERQSAQARALFEKSAYLLPVKLDDSSLPGLRPTIGYLDGVAIGSAGIVEAFQAKLATAVGRDDDPAAPLRSAPSTDAGIQRLATEKPVHWEYTLYGSMVRRGLQALAQKRRDHGLGIAKPSGRIVLEGEALTFIRQFSNDAVAIGSRFDKVLSPEVREAAFGAPGQPGDVEAISYAATRLVDVYEDWLDWAASLRGLTVSESEARSLFDAFARYADQPVRAIAETMSTYMSAIDGFLADDDPDAKLQLTLTIVWEIPEETQADYERALEAYTQARHA